ncbi:hypothetical protein [Pyrodictium abyssi]|uniref:Uncharacterized protein n=1 Tax=Pyrodictium abyssi TaxID=54256 RepID=A0ABN6ZJN5_9CREN|nr:hypothetical protein PABY_00380 [Pyrodictium abyssi]
MALAVLFTYKALKEAATDPIWSLIYILISLEYLTETPTLSTKKQ